MEGLGTVSYTHLDVYKRQLVDEGDIGVKSASLRGFYQWTPEQVATEQQRYETALRKAARILADEESHR